MCEQRQQGQRPSAMAPIVPLRRVIRAVRHWPCAPAPSASEPAWAPGHRPRPLHTSRTHPGRCRLPRQAAERAVGPSCRRCRHTSGACPSAARPPASIAAVDPAGGGHAVGAALDDCGVQEGGLQRALPGCEPAVPTCRRPHTGALAGSPLLAWSAINGSSLPPTTCPGAAWFIAGVFVILAVSASIYEVSQR